MVLGIYTFAQAQNKSKGAEFAIGVGYNGAYVTESGSGQTTKILSGYNVAASVDNYFSEAWSLKAKAILDKKGWSNGFLTTPSGTSYGVNFDLTYLTVPVMANWHFGKTRNWYLNFGPYIGFLMSAKAAGYDVKEVFNSTDAGLDVGIGVKLPISARNKFFIEYDGQSGVTNVFTSQSPTKIQNVRGSFNVGITF